MRDNPLNLRLKTRLLHFTSGYKTAARLAQLGERRSAEREAVGSSPGRTNTQGLKITEEKVLPL